MDKLEDLEKERKEILKKIRTINPEFTEELVELLCEYKGIKFRMCYANTD